MKQNIWCKFLNLHKDEILNTEDLKNPKGDIIGKVIISRCTNCGKITVKTINTEYYER